MKTKLQMLLYAALLALYAQTPLSQAAHR